MARNVIDHELLLGETFLRSFEHHKVLDSTNNRAKQLVREGVVELPMLILADSQTAGRGRGSNRWWTGPGSLAFSLVIDSSCWSVGRNQVSLSSLAAGIAAVEAVSPQLPQREVGLHWPNDVYVGDRKLAGILVEMPRPDRMVVGVGINTNCRLSDAPEEIGRRVTTMIDITGESQDHTNLLVAWLAAWENWINRLERHPEEIGARADVLCLQRAHPIRVRQGEQVWEGECQGIGSDGALLVMAPDGVREIYSGTVE